MISKPTYILFLKRDSINKELLEHFNAEKEARERIKSLSDSGRDCSDLGIDKWRWVGGGYRHNKTILSPEREVEECLHPELRFD